MASGVRLLTKYCKFGLYDMWYHSQRNTLTAKKETGRDGKGSGLWTATPKMHLAKGSVCFMFQQVQSFQALGSEVQHPKTRLGLPKERGLLPQNKPRANFFTYPHMSLIFSVHAIKESK